ncbi:MAG TPA: hypothetical protein VGQ42_14720 [Candidatus Dormibacteraeota bacterium]|jgi:hypothetical protein|nr:hypothetical protein [Candidatus Dormibacteraeota bacterium]
MTKGIRWRIIVLQVGLIGILSFAAGFLFWANSFSHNMVGDELAAQNISVPAVGSPGFDAKTLGDTQYADLSQYAGQAVTTGPQAQAYANDYINVHLQKVAAGQTYSQVSGKLVAEQAKPTPDAKVVATLSGQRTTLFMGETLRGLLLNAYGWWQVGQYALYAAIGLLIAAIVVLGAMAFELVGWRAGARAKKPAATTATPLTVPRPTAS